MNKYLAQIVQLKRNNFSALRYKPYHLILKLWFLLMKEGDNTELYINQ